MKGIFHDSAGLLRKGWLAALYAGVVFVLLALLQAATRSLGVGPSYAVFHAEAALAAVIATVILLRLAPELHATDPLARRAGARSIVGYAAVGAAVPTAVVPVLALAGAVVWRDAPPPHPAEVLDLALPGFSEELLVRGTFLACLVGAFGRGGGLLVASGIFGLLHVGNPHATPVGILVVCLSGVLLGLIVLRTGSIWPAVAAHAAWNVAEGNVFGLPVSGMAQPRALVPVALEGPEWLTGGAFGPEASAVTLGALVIGCFALAWGLPRATGGPPPAPPAA